MRRVLPFLLATALLAGCLGPGGDNLPVDGTPTTDGEPTDGPVTITFATWEYERATYEPLIASFQTEYPDINVVMVPLEDSMQTTSNQPTTPLSMLRTIVTAADTAPAVYLSPEAYGTNLVYNLAPLMEADSSFNRGDFYEGALNAYSTDGGVWAIPRTNYVSLLAYNKELLTQAGVPAPSPDWSWTDVLDAAQATARTSGNEIETYGLLEWSNGLFPTLGLLAANQVEIFPQEGAPLNIDRPEVVAVFEQVHQMAQNGTIFAAPPMTGEGDEPATPPDQLIREGKAAIWLADMLPSDPNVPESQLPFEVGYAPLPPLSNGLNFGGGADGFMISGGTQHPNEAWKWIEFLSRQMTFTGGSSPSMVPARKSMGDQMSSWKSLPQEQKDIYLAALQRTKPATVRFSPTTEAAYTTLYTVLSQLMAEDANIPELVRNAQQEAQTALTDRLKTPEPTPDNSVVSVATPVPNVAPEGATAISFGAYTFDGATARRLARAFQEQRPDIFVTIKTADQTSPSSIADVAAQTDCFSWWETPRTQADFDALLNIRPLLDSDASFQQSDIIPAALSLYDRNGNLYGFPQTLTLRSVGYSKAAFTEAGLDAPTASWTPEQFLAAAQALTKGEGDTKRYGYVPLSGAQGDLIFFVSQFGTRLSTGTGDDLRPNFTDPNFARALQWYIDLSTVHKVSPPLALSYSPESTGPAPEDDPYMLVQSGRGAMWLDYGAGSFTSIGEGTTGGIPIDGPVPAPSEEFGPDGSATVGIAPLPIGANGMPLSEVSSRGFFISAQSEQSAACWDWIKFLSNDVSTIYGDLPARLSLLDSEQFKEQSSPALPALAKAYASSLTSVNTNSDIPNEIYTRFDLYWLFKAIDDAAKGERPLEEGLADAQAKTTTYVTCMVREDQKKPATCAKEADPQYNGYNTQDPDDTITIPRG